MINKHLSGVSDFVSPDLLGIKQSTDRQTLAEAFDERIDEDYADDIARRARKPIYTDHDYNNYKLCANRLKKGIEVIKHHYTSPGCCRVIVKLSKDERYLKYKKVLEACALEQDLAILPGGDLAEIGEKAST